MRCLQPSLLPLDGDEYVMVRCRKCRHCRKTRQRSWTGRLALEMSGFSTGRFLTLTYACDPIELQYRDVQLFMKRVRERYDRSFRYFVVGEYGGRNGRGHWHALIFGLEPETIGYLETGHCWSAWPHGHIFDGEVSSRSIAYVAGYTMKFGCEKRPSIQRQSLRPGIGLAQLERMGASEASTSARPRHPSSLLTYSFNGQRYPFDASGRIAYLRGYANAGGSALAGFTPEQQRELLLSALDVSSWGSLRSQEHFIRKELKNEHIRHSASFTAR